jgi:hypothetical protein
LAVGNYLNGGTNRGQADGFDLEALSKLDGVKDSQNKSLRHFVFDVFFNQMSDSAASLVDELAPCLSNITRRVTKDSSGAEAISKSARLTLEDVDQAIRTVEAEFASKKEMMHMVLQYIEDPADNFKLQMPGRFAQIMNLVGKLINARDSIKEKYMKVLRWFKILGMNSGDFCLLWDDFLIPGDMIMSKAERVRKDVMIPKFCTNRPVSSVDIAMLWEFRDPSNDSGPSSGGALPRTSNAMRRRVNKHRLRQAAAHQNADEQSEKEKEKEKEEVSRGIALEFAQRLMALTNQRKASQQELGSNITTAEKFARRWVSGLKRKQSEDPLADSAASSSGPSPANIDHSGAGGQLLKQKSLERMTAAGFGC